MVSPKFGGWRDCVVGTKLRGMRLLAFLVCLSCAKGAQLPSYGAAGTAAAFDLDADTSQTGMFYELPYPSDLRLTADGKPQLAAFPNPRGLPMIETFRQMAMQRGGFPVVPVAYFKFDAPLAQEASGLLYDLETGAQVPTVSVQPPADDYVPANLLAVAPRPGFVLTALHQYAFVVPRSARDAQGNLLGVPPALDQLLHGVLPDGALGQKALQLYAPLAALHLTDVAAATVFTTGDAVAETAALTERVRAQYSVSIENLALDATDNPEACVFTGGVRFPQFQQGVPPFDTGGLFAPDLAKQRDDVAPVAIVVPKGIMPDSGWPLDLYFHGSGGFSRDVIDKGPTLVAGGQPEPGFGPGYVLAMHGIASAGSALPVNPERLPGAGETAYLNFQNLPAMRDTFRQGIIEQRLYLDALLKLQIPVTACTPDGGHFDAAKVVAQGQSMGGMYTNLISAIEPRITAAVPTGAGGFWTYFILVTHLHEGLPDLVALLLHAAQPLSFMHPALHLIETAWEPADPFVSMPRLSRRPLPGNPSRPIYEPVGKDDPYFPTVLYDAVALAYQHREAGDVQWPSMQDALKLEGLDGLLAYPVRDQNVVVQYQGDGIEDPHAIYRQLDAVKHQYGCFLETFLATGHPVVPAPAALGTPCAR